MEWIKFPTKEEINSEGICFFRICNNKAACEGYQCIVLFGVSQEKK